MNTRNFFTIETILLFLFGLGLTFATDFMGRQYLTNPSWINEGAKLLAQGWGTMLLATGVACWYIRDAGDSLGGKVMLLLLLVSNLALIVIHTLAVLNGVETTLGWAQVLLSLGLAVWSGLLLQQTNRVAA